MNTQMYNKNTKRFMPRRIDTLFNKPSKPLGGMLNTVNLLQAITEIVHECLTDDQKPHLVGVNLKDSTLILLVDSSAWATRFRLMSQNLLYQINQQQIFQSHDIRLYDIHCQVGTMQAARAKAPAQKRQAEKMSRENAAGLRELASYVNDEALSLALKRLSRWEK